MLRHPVMVWWFWPWFFSVFFWSCLSHTVLVSKCIIPWNYATYSFVKIHRIGGSAQYILFFIMLIYMAHDFMALCNSHWPSVLYFLSWFISCEGRVSTVNDTAKSQECNTYFSSLLVLNPVWFVSCIVSKNRTGTIVIQRKKINAKTKKKK